MDWQTECSAEEKEKDQLFSLVSLEAEPDRDFYLADLVEECSLEKEKGKQEGAKGGAVK